MENVHDVFEFMLLGLYSAEKRSVEMLEDLTAEAEEPALREAFQRHRDETERQAERLEEVFAVLNLRPRVVDASVLEGLIEEKRRVRSEDPNGRMLQVYNLTAAMKNEMIEISAYENALLLAERLNAPEVVDALRQNLEEERATLTRLQDLARDSAMLDKDVGTESRRTETTTQ